MAFDEKRRQKKLAKKAAKRKAKLASLKPWLSTGGGLSPAQAAPYPLYECLVPEGLFTLGIGNVILTRSLPNGDFAMAGFLVDVYCLGVKNALYNVVSAQDYAAHLHQFEAHAGRFERVHPSCLRKLVEGAVDYARQLGFAPHPDYAQAAKLFGDIEAAACPVRYAYGKDGKPFYISGPQESPTQSRRIIDTLSRRLGPDGFHFMTALGVSEDASALQAPASDLTAVSYEITDEPIREPVYERLPQPVKEQLDTLYHETVFQKPGEAIAVLQTLIERYPEVPQLYNYLYTAYQQLGDQDNSQRVLQETLARFPNYLFGRIAYAMDCLQRGEPEKVPEILDNKYELKLLYPERERFHISEVLGFYTVLAWYFHTQGERDRAETYYQLLRQLAPQHRNTRFIEQLLYPSQLKKWLQALLPKPS